MTRPLVSGLLALAACGVNPAYDDRPTAPPAGTDTGTGPGPGDDPTTGSTGHAGTLEDPTVDPSTGALLPASTSTDATTTTGDPDTTSTADATTGPDGPPTMEEHLQFYDNADCNAPLWCQQDMMPPAPARTHAQLCFRPASAPPYHLTRIGWLIADTQGELGSTSNLAVYTGDDNGPVDKVWEISLGAPEVSDAYPHAFVLGDPLVLKTPVFCVGLSGGGDGPPSALGVALDTSEQAAGRSYFAVDPGASCTTDGWTDVADLPFGPKGTWCIDATILGH